MKLSQLKQQLGSVDQLIFELPQGGSVARHFHITEVGQIHKHFIDCGGTVRHEIKVSLQLWEANDLDHRLEPEKLRNIISLSEKTLGIEDSEIEVEYQAGGNIGKYGLEFNGTNFLLTGTTTACLASDNCGSGKRSGKKSVKLSDLVVAESSPTQACCSPEGGCCN